MATTSEVKAGLDDISQMIRAIRASYTKAKAQIVVGYTQLNAIPTTFSDVLTTINAYVGTDPFEANAKDEKAKLTTEFQSLKATILALTETTEFSA